MLVESSDLQVNSLIWHSAKWRTWRSMRRESKPLRYMPIVCFAKDAMPRSICPAVVLLWLLALLASCTLTAHLNLWTHFPGSGHLLMP